MAFEDRYHGVIAMKSPSRSHTEILCEINVTVTGLVVVEAWKEEIQVNQNRFDQLFEQQIQIQKSPKQRSKRRKLRVEWKEILDLLPFYNDSHEIEYIILVVSNKSRYYISNISSGMKHFHVLISGFWETHLIQRTLKLENFQVDAPSEDCLDYYLETMKYLRYGDQGEAKSIAKFLEVISDFSSEVLINMNLKSITLSNVDMFVILTNIINFLLGNGTNPLISKYVIDESWEDLFPNEEIGKTKVGKGEEVQKALRDIINQRLRIIDKCLECLHAILFGSELIKIKVNLIGDDNLLDIGSWVGILIVDYYSTFCEKLGCEKNIFEAVAEPAVHMEEAEPTPLLRKSSSKSIGSLLRSSSKSILVPEAVLIEESLKLREKIFTEQASILALLMEWYSLSTLKLQSTGKGSNDPKTTKWVKSKQIPTDAFKKEFFRSLLTSETVNERIDPENKVFGECMTKTAGWEVMVDGIVLLFLKQIERVNDQGADTSRDEIELSIFLLSLYYLCRMIKVLSSESYKVREVLKSDSCRQWSSVINLLNVMCPIQKGDMPNNQLSIEVPNDAGRNQYWSDTNQSQKNSSPDRFKLETQPKSPSLWMSLSNIVQSPVSRGKSANQLFPINEEAIETYGVEYPADPCVPIIDYGRPRVQLRKSQYSLLILTKRSIEEFLQFIGIPFDVSHENQRVRDILPSIPRETPIPNQVENPIDGDIE